MPLLTFTKDILKKTKKLSKKALTRSCKSGIIAIPLRVGFFVVQW